MTENMQNEDAEITDYEGDDDAQTATSDKWTPNWAEWLKAIDAGAVPLTRRMILLRDRQSTTFAIQLFSPNMEQFLREKNFFKARCAKILGQV